MSLHIVACGAYSAVVPLEVLVPSVVPVPLVAVDESCF